jgi:hypothetical protein
MNSSGLSCQACVAEFLEGAGVVCLSLTIYLLSPKAKCNSRHTCFPWILRLQMSQLATPRTRRSGSASVHTPWRYLPN